MDLHQDGGVPRLPGSPDGAWTRATAELAATLVAARSGDEAAIQSIYAALHPRLHRYLRHHVGDSAADVASDVWLSVARALPRFDGDPTAFRALIFTIAHRRVVDHHRRSRRQPTTVPLGPEFDLADGDDHAERVVDGLRAQDAIRILVEELPADQAEIVLLRVLGGLDAAQVASIVGKTPGAVRVTQYRALRRLQRVLQKFAVTR